MIIFPTWIADCDSHNPALLDFFLFSGAITCFTVAFHPLGNSDHVVVSVSNDFLSNSKWIPRFIVQPLTFLMLTGMVFLIFRKMLHGRISLNSVLLLLLVNLVSGFRLELMYISIIVNIGSSFTHSHDFKLLQLVHRYNVVHRSQIQLIDITFLT